ncbi:MarR family winged helix-turn-helix transcriptional regulator [Streptomyces sp. TLI_171]|uniref:MarR family winged helix-turn-helix transcriptional regulator n=1 Tax=Streptomyces sp. TLI_171 TaxID=1938859 RepID=UPI000C17F9C1|nr:MarR family transcriptional regulator [Streptomyces sp. TLI_171]
MLYRLGLRSGSLFDAALEQHGLRLRHHAILRYLATVDGARQRELADRLGYDPSAIVALLDDLQRLGLAERRADPADRRSRQVVLTEAGRELLRTADRDSRRVTEELLEPLDPAERATLNELLQRVATL